MTAVRNRLGAHPEHMAKSYDQHVKLLALIERSEVDAVVDLLDRHIRHKGESFWNVPNTLPKSRWERILQLSE
jgi:DNA-binding GntR family transcriptional regulator